jgi:hypothetical protein
MLAYFGHHSKIKLPTLTKYSKLKTFLSDIVNTSSENILPMVINEYSLEPSSSDSNNMIIRDY